MLFCRVLLRVSTNTATPAASEAVSIAQCSSNVVVRIVSLTRESDDMGGWQAVLLVVGVSAGCLLQSDAVLQTVLHTGQRPVESKRMRQASWRRAESPNACP